METLVTITLAAAWAAIVGMFAWGVLTGWRRLLSNEGTLPLFDMLERRGLVLARLEQAPDTLYGAVRRCAMCRERKRCRDWLERRIGPAPACPNEGYFEDAARA